MALTLRLSYEGKTESRALRALADKVIRRNLIKSGAAVRTIARRSIRRRKKISSPGSPPHAHSPGSTGLKLIRYQYNAAQQVVTVGPAVYGSQDEPGALEHGGVVRIRRKSRRAQRRKIRLVRIKARPYMRPALRAAAPVILTIWKDSLR